MSSEPVPRTEAQGPGLQANAIGFIDALAIGLNATSPAYSIAAILGPLALLVGVYMPGVLIVSFIPMLLIASAFYYLNRVDQDCGTTFSWVSRAMGPWWGWLGGWAITLTGVLVVGSLADVAVRFTLLMVGQDELADSDVVVVALSVVLILLMSWLCVIGTEVSARLQNVLVLLQVSSLLIFAGVALARAIGGSALPDAPTPSLEWLNPFAEGSGALTAGLLLGVFAYWGWESAVNLTEETADSASAPGRAGVWSTIILVITYVGTAIAVVAFVGPTFLADNAEEAEFIVPTLAEEVLGTWDWIVLLAVATSALASTQTTIIPASRTALSMARRRAVPRRLGHISGQHHTPDVATWWVAAIAIAWYVPLALLSENALFDSLSALSLLIAFYYALTGIACAIYYRRHLLDGPKNLLLIGLGPVIGALMLIWLLGLSVRDLADPANSYTGDSWFGLGPPLVIGLAVLGVGVVLMIASRLTGSPFWRERAGVVDDGLLPPRRSR